MLCNYLPGIEWFANDNPYTECIFDFHYIIIPDVKEETMTVRIWNGKFCYEKSLEQIIFERVFPLTKGGRDEAIEYIRNKNVEVSKSLH